MIINFKESKLPNQILRKIKLDRIEGKKIFVSTNYDWKATPENSEESIKDLHIFCLEVSRNLLLNEFKTNEKGVITYNVEDDQDTISKIEKMISVIERKKRKEKKKMEKENAKLEKENGKI